MAKIRDFVFTEDISITTPFTGGMPTHQADDLLIAFCNCDAGSYWPPLSGSGWLDVTGSGALAGSGHGSRVYYRIATGSSHSFTGSLTTAETKTITIVSVKNVNTSSVFNVISQRVADDNTVPFAGSAVTTTSGNCLVFSFLSTDGGLGPVCEPPWTNITNGDSTANSGGLSYYIKKTAGIVSASNWRGQIADNTTAWTLAINDDGNLSSLDPYLQPNTTTGRLIEHGYWLTAAGTNAWGNQFSTTSPLATIGTKTVTFDAAALAADQGLNPYWGAAQCTPAQNSSGTVLGGANVLFGTLQDLSNGISFYNYLFTSPRDYIDVSTTTDRGQVGLVLVLQDNTGSYRAWSVGAKNTVTTKPDGYNTVGVQCSQTSSTAFAFSSSSFDTFNSTKVIRMHTLGQALYGALDWKWSHFCVGYTQPIAGGTSSEPLTINNINFLLNRSLGVQRVVLKEGAANTILLPVRIGGDDPVHVNVDLQVLQFRKRADGIDYLDWHVDDNFVGFEFDGDPNDTIKFTNCVFTSESPYHWRFTNAHSSGSNIDFNGTTVVKGTVTLKPTVTLDNVNFINCSTFAQSSSILNECTFTDTTVLSDIPSNITGSTFQSTLGNAHGIEILSTGSYTFLGNTFSGFSGDNTTGSAVYNNSGGSVTLTIVGGGSTPTVRNGTSASTTVVANTQITITGLVSGSEVRVMTAGTETELTGTESTSTSYVFSLPSATIVDIVIHHLEYEYLRINSFTIPSVDTSIPVEQRFDRNYSNP